MTENRLGQQPLKKPAAHYVLPDHIFPDLIQHVRLDRCSMCPGVAVCKRSRRRLLPCDRPDRGHHHHSRLRNRLCAVQKAWCKGKGEGCRRCWLHVLSLAHLRRAGSRLRALACSSLWSDFWAPPADSAYIRDYGRILLAGTIISTGFSGVMRANGDISYSTLQWSLPVLLNMVLDPLFIYVFHMGISGAAWQLWPPRLFPCLPACIISLYGRRHPAGFPCAISAFTELWQGKSSLWACPPF